MKGDNPGYDDECYFIFNLTIQSHQDLATSTIINLYMIIMSTGARLIILFKYQCYKKRTLLYYWYYQFFKIIIIISCNFIMNLTSVITSIV